MLRLWPHRLRGEGHFVALLRREGARRPRRLPGMRPIALPEDLPAVLPARMAGYAAFERGDRVHACHPWLREMEGVRTIKKGVCLYRRGRGYVEPEHSLGMALSPREAAARELTGEEALEALSGQTLPTGGRGWQLMTIQGMPLGWGKASGGVLKNHIPKGLRRDAYARREN